MEDKQRDQKIDKLEQSNRLVQRQLLLMEKMIKRLQVKIDQQDNLINMLMLRKNS